MSLYAAQATCTVDPTVLQPQSGAFGDFFDPENNLVGANQADPSAGTWIGAITQRNPALPRSGDGLFATISYQATGPGMIPIVCEPVLSSQDGYSQAVTYIGANVTVLNFMTVNGIATYQGRLTHSGIQVSATGVVSRATTTDSAGNFALDQLKAGNYQVTADAARFLPSCTSFTVVNGQPLTLTATALKGGDANDDSVINIGDATLVAANFGLQVPPADERADMNADDTVNILDLAVLGGNYGLSGCQSW
jgi:hypothetical protein